MPKPEYNGKNARPDQAASEAAAQAGLPVIDGKQAVSSARKWSPDKGGFNWYALDDGTEAVRDDDANPASWPE